MSWQELKNLIQSLDEQHKGRKKGEPFEELVAELLGALLETRFETAKSGYQPIGDVQSRRPIGVNFRRSIIVGNQRRMRVWHSLGLNGSPTNVYDGRKIVCFIYSTL